MKFPQHTRIFRGQLDTAAFAGVFLLLTLFLLLHTSLVFTPGVTVRLPESAALPGTRNRTVFVTVDWNGQVYFEDQVISDDGLKEKLRTAVARAKEPVTLVLLADKDTRYDVIVRLGLLARETGIREMLQATRPETVPVAAPSAPAPAPATPP
jgi:biopolymer transport protein ExbD